MIVVLTLTGPWFYCCWCKYHDLPRSAGQSINSHSAVPSAQHGCWEIIITASARPTEHGVIMHLSTYQPALPCFLQAFHTCTIIFGWWSYHASSPCAEGYGMKSCDRHSAAKSSEPLLGCTSEEMTPSSPAISTEWCARSFWKKSLFMCSHRLRAFPTVSALAYKMSIPERAEITETSLFGCRIQDAASDPWYLRGCCTYLLSSLPFNWKPGCQQNR